MWSVMFLPALVLVATFFGHLVTICRSINILYISSVASPSHFLWSQRLFEKLAGIGYNITVVNLYKHGRIRDVQFIKLDGIIDNLVMEDDDYIEFGQMNPFEMVMSFFELELYVCELAIKTPGFRFLLEYPRNFKFELVIHDHLAGPCLLVILSHFNYPPLILASAYNRFSTTTESLGSLVYPGFIPNQVYDIHGFMNYYQRIYNFMLFIWESLWKNFIYYPKLDSIINVELNQTIAVSSLEKRALLAILNSNPILEPFEPKLTNVIQAGGLHIKPTKPLPTTILNAIERSFDGVVLFSLGTNARSDLLSSSILSELITVMRRLPSLTFLWKLDSDHCLPSKLPANVYSFSWLPQNDILAHPKLQLFITHGGLLSIQEAVWHGVPILGIPIYADQFGNVNQMVDKGIGKRLDLTKFSSRQFEHCIVDIITNNRRAAVQLSQIVRDQKEQPLDLAVWFVEWALRNANTAHVWNQSLQQFGVFQKYSLDVIIILLICLAIITYLMFMFWKSICCRKTSYKMKAQ
ncbi:UDP-glucuronosyltransferase 2B16-like isoform X2 [Malaya genurostris]|uniref:UDP-glucuronosyltransferase 2B16-like isoform X2 n=1 Tax=Malaya genurostris TaxID=325434 RepID=UPI0026F4026D|nr:UDP-glucuronosyltransferase 2B16-like isoform X2 [Malaya genurostris]